MITNIHIKSFLRAVSSYDELTFHDACKQGELIIVRRYCSQKGFDMYIGDHFGRTGFHFACFNGNLNVVQLLIKQKFNIYIGDNAKKTGFHWACFNGNLNVVQVLLDKGFDMNVRDDKGKTGFHEACFRGKVNVVRLLLEEGFDMYIGDVWGFTGFHVACVGGKVTPFAIRIGWTGPNAPQSNESTEYPCVGNLDVIQILLKKGIDMKHRTKNGMTGFHIACTCGHLKAAQLLLRQGFDVNTVDHDKLTGLLWACFAGSFNVIRFLLYECENIDHFSLKRTGIRYSD
jgi:ankyrin repeat protein